MLDLMLFHPIPVAIATVMALWATAESLAVHRGAPARVNTDVKRR